MQSVSFLIVGLATTLLTLSSVVFAALHPNRAARFLKQQPLTNIMLFVFVFLTAIGAIIRLFS